MTKCNWLDSAPLVLGMMRLLDHSELQKPESLADWMASMIDQGLNVFDHADIYGKGECEKAFGQALARQPQLRTQIRLITKADIVPAQEAEGRWPVKHYRASGEHLVKRVERSLTSLNTDHIDLFLIHRPDPLMDLDSTAKALERLVADGKVGQVGVSNHLPEQWRLLQSALSIPLVANQVELSLGHTDALFDGTQDAWIRDGLKPMAWSPLGGGGLLNGERSTALNQAAEEAGLTPAGVALSWLARLPSKPVPLLGSFNSGRIRDALAGVDYAMPRELWFSLLAEVRGFDVP